MIVPEFGVRAIARVHLPFGITRNLYAAQPIASALQLPVGTALADVLAAARAITFPGSGRPTTTALMQSTHGWSLVPLGIMRTSAGERVLGPFRLSTMSGVVERPLATIQRRAEHLVGLADDSLHALLA
jgi:hypothetical protein